MADAQEGMLSRRQLRGLHVSESELRHHVAMERWAHRSSGVVSTTTGPLSPDQRLWLGVLHAGPSAMVGGLSAAALHGLNRWPREEITILVANPMSYAPLPGFRFFRTRRPFALLIGKGELPVARVEPAVLMFASEETHLRTALGAVTASVQQRLTTVERLREWLGLLAPLRRARQVRTCSMTSPAGAHSLAEVDLRKACRDHDVHPPRSQRVRYDRAGHKRYTDGEWTLPDGRGSVLEVDGAFHDDAIQGTLDRRRNRKLTSATRTVVQCSAWEIRHEPWEVMEDLIALGVPRTAS